MARNNQYPIMLGGVCEKEGIGIKSKLGSGYDLYIMSKDMQWQIAQIHFCTKESIDNMIKLLQMIKELWEKEEKEHDKKMIEQIQKQ